MRITIVAALSRNHVIGTEGTLPWNMPSDLKRFRDLTSGHPIVMGRRTWDSIGRPLPRRQTIVVSRSLDLAIPGAESARSIDQALAQASIHAETMGVSEVFVVGGAEIYAQALPRTDRLHLTTVEADVDGATCFPDFDGTTFLLSSETRFDVDGDDHPATVRVFERRVMDE